MHAQAEFRSIIFALCYFHAALLERKKFGVGNLPGATSGIGWNMNYPFNTGDLLCCGQCASNYLENNVKVCAWRSARSVQSSGASTSTPLAQRLAQCQPPANCFACTLLLCRLPPVCATCLACAPEDGGGI